MPNPDALYAAFDMYPSAKGAATHIKHLFETMIDVFEHPLLFALGNEYLPEYQTEEQYSIRRFVYASGNMLERATAYMQALEQEYRMHAHSLELVHFRDVWSGTALLQAKKKNVPTVFEVNALPTIELPYRYPLLLPKTLAKIYDMESYCLENANHIIVPSQVIKNILVHRAIEKNKISVISNGATPTDAKPKPADAPDNYLIYFGALQRWQGVDVLIKAMSLLRDLDIKLLIASSNKARHAKALQKYATKLELSDQIIWKYELPKEELYAYVQHAILSVAPLKEDDRNVKQGASPIKIFESMANKCPVVASDLAIVREIFRGNHKAVKLFRPDRPAELARVIRFLLEFPNVLREMQTEAFEVFEQHHQWKSKKDNLKQLYKTLCLQKPNHGS